MLKFALTHAGYFPFNSISHPYRSRVAPRYNSATTWSPRFDHGVWPCKLLRMCTYVHMYACLCGMQKVPVLLTACSPESSQNFPWIHVVHVCMCAPSLRFAHSMCMCPLWAVWMVWVYMYGYMYSCIYTQSPHEITVCVPASCPNVHLCVHVRMR